MANIINIMTAAGAPLLMRIISSSVAVANRAANIIRDIMKKGELGIVEKEGKHDLQTEADRSAQRCIVASLHKQFPNVPVIGEEDLDTQDLPADFLELSFDEDVLKCVCPDQYKDVKEEDIVIWVDPVDGTAEYTQGLLDHVTTLIGISVKGVAKAGAYGFERKNPPQGQNIITTTRSHSDEIITQSVEACKPTEILRVGGAGHKVLLLIEGKVHAYVFASPGCKKWDTCAPEAILHTIGGKLTDMHEKCMKLQMVEKNEQVT
ncbi:hypothetical protein KUTeg_013379 [Tegillarca granosa]|uniref:3'(2'),5'-bisphosphate nucleotidase 1 n=1 Tax=Tegillarca granosa TaxID=220873 RepID=A0ABQ9EYN5_TEGGR|nr:hypothetical protein KUTeg_013379 [Tegillarca granosa]